MTESQIQSSIKKYAESKGWICVKTIKLSESGYPDLFCFKNGKTVFIEVKTEKGVISELQKYRQKQLQTAGFESLIVKSLYEAKNILDLF